MKETVLAASFLILGVICGWTGSNWIKSNRPSLDQEKASSAAAPRKGSTAWLITQLQADVDEGFRKRSQELKGKEATSESLQPGHPDRVNINGKTYVATGPLDPNHGCIGYKEIEFTLEPSIHEMLADCTFGADGQWVVMPMPNTEAIK